MKRILLLISLITSFSFFAQGDNSKNEIQFSGEYTGKFTDLNNNQGTIQLFLYSFKNGASEGIILMKKNDLKTITGTIRITGNEKHLSGQFTPSKIKNTTSNTQYNPSSTSTDSFECMWNLYGEIQGHDKRLIKGKAVPNNCSESNLITFTLNKNG